MTDPQSDHQLLVGHLREHDLLADAHRREHEGLLREIAGAATALDGKVRDTATAFDIRMRDATAQLETRVKEVADLHWANHRVEHASDQRAIDKVETAVATRFESVNEFREQLREQAAKFLMRDEYLTSGKAVNDRIVALETFRNQNEGQSHGQAPYIAVIFAAVGSVGGALILHFLLAPK
jgi:quinol monooxygenase YgiN